VIFLVHTFFLTTHTHVRIHPHMLAHTYTRMHLHRHPSTHTR